jgi:hypothetical protein
MTAIAVLNIILGAIVILGGLFQLLGAIVFMYELLRLGAFEIPVGRLTFSLLLLATGIVGVIAGAGILRLRPWARPLSLVYAGLLILSAALSCFLIPILAAIGTYDFGAIDASGWVRLIIFAATYVVLPVPYALVLCLVVSKPAWKTAFAKGRPA